MNMKALGIFAMVAPTTALAMTLGSTRERMPFGLITVQPTFTVSDWGVARTALADFLDLARKETGCCYCGWTRCTTEDKLFISEAFRDADAVIAHVQAYKQIRETLSDAVSLQRMQVHGPPVEIEKCLSAMPEGTECFAAREPGGFSYFSKQTGGLMTAQTLCSLKPMLKVTDWDAAEKIMAEYLERASLEAGLIYIGWTASNDDERLFCRVAHSNANAVLEHLINVAPCLQALLDGPATLESIELHGPQMQIERVQQAGTLLDGLGAEYYVTQSGFQKYECWSSYVAQGPGIRFG